ncbi:MAG: hypothetical protein U0R19_16775 [Bryobacteraceae bacterium]
MTNITRRVLLALACGASALTAQDGWTRYTSSDYGFSMLIPQGTKIEEREWGRGWAGVRCTYDGVIFTGIGKLGRESERDIVQFGIEATGIAERYWTQIDKGKGYKVYRAEAGDEVLLAAIGFGSKASFLLFLKTTKSDMRQHQADYQTWYESVEIR